MKAAYVVGNITVIDEEKWSEYRNKVPSTLVPWGGELVFRGNTLDVLSGDHQHTDNVIIRFPNSESLSNWFNSADYQALIPIRKQAAIMNLVSYQADN
ncbi:DUF1330 domain-containing protein [Psychrobium sp. 1_MG-2023]|uniref:DUF1330 domain-containing protein n=1 Tax=Psychrobium sp. 1_MG-2023 TaxID=3062624 RepID=UPI000C32F723|nr:DUF1330 domain-containing protein [Psychrobium sp. 1_MG-2023]MDP2562598.1 DUF1330 domain-containing protein [Psychrobium sp. 1_MG-2023]PKF59638.1 DUF1330 domain-containing protein [Alteromonadales bacterium alter-6D02]